MHVRKERGCGKRRLALLLVLAMVCAMLVGPFTLAAELHTGADVSEKLTDISAVVKQNGSVIEAGDSIDPEQDLVVEVLFTAPLYDAVGDSPIIALGDYAKITLGTGIQVTDAAADFIFYADDRFPVATGALVADPDGNLLYLDIAFDQEALFDDHTIDKTSCKLSLTMRVMEGGGAEGGDRDTVTILDKEYTVVPSGSEQNTFTMNKSGAWVESNPYVVTWTVAISGVKSNGSAADLGGYQFSDDLTDVGAYVTDSFVVNGVTPDSGVDYVGSLLTYTFPTGSNKEQIVTFQTVVTGEQLAHSTTLDITNTAQLMHRNEAVADGTGTVSIKPTWILKEGTSLKPGTGQDRIVRWTITANAAGATLTNMRITDTLQDGQEFSKAYWRSWDSTTNKWSEDNQITPNENGVYLFESVTTKIQLIIEAKVTYTNDWKPELKNTATISWDGVTGGGEANGRADVDFSIISKADGGYDWEDATNPWTVTVDATGMSELTNLRTCELLVYGNQKLKVDEVAWPGDLPLTFAQVSTVDQALNQRYVEDSFTDTTPAGGTPLQMTVKTIYDFTGAAVADLLVVSGADQSWGISDESKTIYTYTFKTIATNPALFAVVNNGAGSYSNLRNFVGLFRDEELLCTGASTSAWKNMQLKDALLSDKAAALTAALKDGWKDDTSALLDLVNSNPGNAEANTSNADKVYDYTDHSVIFRLHVNANDQNWSSNGLTDAKGQPCGPLTVEDQLPAGWELRELVDGSPYLVLDGEGKTGRYDMSGFVRATSAFTGQMTSTAKVGDDQASFLFTDLTGACVILLKAGPTEETQKKYFSTEQTIVVENQFTETSENWGEISAPKMGITTVKITGGTLSKGHRLYDAGIVEWTVNYTGKSAGTDVKLEDTLPVGIDLRVDADGALLLESGGKTNIALYPLMLQQDGTYKQGLPCKLTVDENVAYNNKSRQLTVTLPDDGGAYRLVYLTDVTGEPGKVSNTVRAVGSKGTSGATSDEYEITKRDCSAVLERSGYIIITKTDSATQKPMSGVQFTIYTEDGFTVIRTGQTDEKGNLTLRGLPDGNYVLRETVPTGYTSQVDAYKLTVADKKASIEGVQDANKLNVQNDPIKVGELQITKTVTGSGGDTSKQFHFTVILTDVQGTPLPGAYPCQIGSVERTISSGDTLALSHGQSANIQGLPEGTRYTVTETEAGADGYTTTKNGDTGVITAGQPALAQFTNSKGTTSTGEPTDPETPTDPEPTQPVSPEENPNIPLIPPGNIPDPGAVDSPDSFILIDENGIPQGVYTKQEQPDGSFVYIDGADVPLGTWELPRMGDEMPVAFWGILLVMTAVGGLLLLRKPTEKKRRR